MKITVSEIPEEGLQLELTETIRSETVKLVSPIRASLKIDKQGSEVLVTGVISGEVELQCSRCLGNFTLKIESPVEVVYHPASLINREEHYELKSEELDMGFYKNDTLDTDDLLVEQLMLAIPMKPLCSPDCKGICPKCGADLNATRCDCKVSEPDPRLQALGKLLKRKE